MKYIFETDNIFSFNLNTVANLSVKYIYSSLLFFFFLLTYLVFFGITEILLYFVIFWNIYILMFM